jgi:hypothetical protein
MGDNATTLRTSAGADDAAILSRALGVSVEVIDEHTMQAHLGRHVVGARAIGSLRSGWRVYLLERFEGGRRYLGHTESRRADVEGLVAAAHEVLAKVADRR